MARLPDDTVYGPLPSADSGRPIATYDTSDIGRGVARLGGAIDDAGDTLNRVAVRERAAKDDLEWATAQSRRLTEKVRLDAERDNLTDPDELERFKPKYQASVDAAAAGISDPNRRKRFLLDAAPHIAASDEQVNTRTFDLKQDQFLADSQTELDNLRNAGLAAKTPEDRARIIEAGQARIQAMEDAGYISAQQRQQMSKRWVENYAVGRLAMMSPADRVEALRGPVATNQRTKSAFDYFVGKGWSPHQAAGIVGNLMQESGLRTDARNAGDGRDGSDSIGIGQWNSDRATRLKRFAEARGTDWRDFNTQLEFVDLELRTSEGKAGSMLTNARDVREATAAMVMYERPAGSQRGAEYADGWANRLRHAETFAAAYAGGKKPANPEGSDVARILPPDQQRAILADAQNEDARQRREAERATREAQTQTATLIGDDLASMEAKGEGLPPAKLSREKVAATLGENAAIEWEAQRVRAQRIHAALDGIETLPEGEVERRLQTMEPAAGTPGFTEDMQAYTRARQKADKFLQARRADPALASEAFHSVRAARQAAEYDEADGVRTVKPGSAQAIVRARLAAQSQMGITEPMAISRSEASVIARQLRLIGEENPAQMEKFIKSLDRTYGEYADEVLAATMQHAKVNRELSLAASDMLRKIAQGTAPAISDTKRVDALIDAQTMNNALQPPGALPREIQGRPPSVRSMMNQNARQTLERAERKNGAPGVTFRPEDIKMLDANRNLATDFDVTYGAGAAEKVLKELDRRMGAQPRGR